MVSSCFYCQLNKVKKVEIPKNNSELNISDNATKQDDRIINAAKQDDKKHKKVKISSVMRDSYVNVDGYGMTKVNHAYAYGGPILAIKTLNKNFDLNIKDYVTVDFFGFEKIIDSVGGVDINITPEELKYINASIPTVINEGLQKFNGRQAVAYTRIRYTAGGDFERTQRQRTVLVAVLNKIKEASSTKIVNVALQFLPYTETSMSNTEILKSLASISTLDINNIDQERFPLDGYCDGKMIDGIWYLI